VLLTLVAEHDLGAPVAEEGMPVTRRQLLRAASIVPIGLTVSAFAIRAGEIIHASAAALRPAASGTSASRCGQCGRADHTMLDPRCPAARKVI